MKTVLLVAMFTRAAGVCIEPATVALNPENYLCSISGKESYACCSLRCPEKNPNCIVTTSANFALGSEPIVFVSMSPYSKLVSNITGTVKRPLC